MNFEDFRSSKQELSLYDGSSAICYLGTHLADLPEERVMISKSQEGSLLLQIENHEYRGELEELEIILWDWLS